MANNCRSEEHVNQVLKFLKPEKRQTANIQNCHFVESHYTSLKDIGHRLIEFDVSDKKLARTKITIFAGIQGADLHIEPVIIHSLHTDDFGNTDNWIIQPSRFLIQVDKMLDPEYKTNDIDDVFKIFEKMSIKSTKAFKTQYKAFLSQTRRMAGLKPRHRW